VHQKAQSDQWPQFDADILIFENQPNGGAVASRLKLSYDFALTRDTRRDGAEDPSQYGLEV
jgi:hypothetical protein